MILINEGAVVIRGNETTIGGEVTMLLYTLKKSYPDVLRFANAAADELLTSGVKVTTHEEIRRFEVEKEN